VVFEPEMNEYNLVIGHNHWIMEYCFSCGGRLPDSRRGDLFLTPSEADVRAVRNAMDGMKTVAEVIAVLGEPDESVNRPESLPPHPKEVVWRRQLRYSRVWPSLDLTILELPSGEIQYVFSGKEKSAQPSSAV
jgi:hypothetical protein